jgi:hypothetical protein
MERRKERETKTEERKGKEERVKWITSWFG